MNRLIEFFAKQGTFVNVITLLVVVLGVFSTIKIRREVFPSVTFDVITITTAFPGASAESTEKLITNPLEQDLGEVDGIKKLTSVSAEGVSVIVLQLDPDQTTQEDAETEVQDVVDAFQDLPDDAEDPVVKALETRLDPIVTVSLTGDLSESEMRSAAKYLEKEIESLPDVAKIDFQGLRDPEIRILTDPSKLNRYRVSLSEIINALKRQNVNIPGGTLEAATVGQKEMIIRTVGEFETADDIGDTVIRANALASAIRIKDVAQIEETFSKEKILYATNQFKSINLTVRKKSNGDAITLVESVKQLIERLKPELHPAIKVTYVKDSSYFVKRRLKVLSNNLLVGLGLVLIILSLILPIPVAIVTAFGIPFSFLGAISIFYFGDVSLNLISMMGLIIVVGMLVDDAVVITENIQAKMEEGLAPMKAAVLGAQGIWAPVCASVLTTVMAFAPMMQMSGIFGKFIQYIPFGVIIALLVSLWEGFFILPHHMATWVKAKDQKQKNPTIFDRAWQKLSDTYINTARIMLRLRYFVLASVIVILGVTGWLFKSKMTFILFPPGAIDTFTVTLETETGTPLEETARLIAPIEERIAALPKNELLNFTTQIGLINAGRSGSDKRGSQYASISVHLTSETERERKAFDIIEELKALPTPEGIKLINYKRQHGGPPVGKPISIGVRGTRFEEILPAVAFLEKFVKTIPGATDVENTFISGKEEIYVTIKKAEAAAAGLSIAAIGTVVRAAYEGIIATSIRTVDEDIKVRVMLSKSLRSSQETLEKLYIPNARGNLIPLKQIATFERRNGVATFEHEANKRQVAVNGEIDTKILSAADAAERIKKFVKDNSEKFKNVEIFYGGENQDTEESMQTLKEAFAFAFFGILLLMILLFRNIYQPLVIATTIPMGIVAVIWAFYFHDMPMTFLGMVGIIALAGVIVNNAIVFVDFVNKSRESGLDRFESILEAAKKRIRPIFLTTVTTTVGILPTAYGIGGLDPFVVPIALALGWGIAFGSVLTTLVFPPMLAIVEDFIAILDKFKARIV